MEVIDIYTDGSIKGGNPGGVCGAGVLIVDGAGAEFYASVYLGPGTNNTAELAAILIGLRRMKRNPGTIRVFTDSQYCQGMLTKRWTIRKNHQLIKAIENEISRLGRVEINWVKGHAGNPGNEEADRLASDAAIDQETLCWYTWEGIRAEAVEAVDVHAPPEHAADWAWTVENG
jgi:ribonuclease HI